MTTTTQQRTKRVAGAVAEYTLLGNEGKPTTFSSLFGKKDTLVVLHNMGETCPNCALWGDEFNGMLKHLETKSAFCIVGPDDPKTQKAYAKARGWQARLYSAYGTTFIKDMGFERKAGHPEPGISILRKDKDGKIHILSQVNVERDGRTPSVLEVLWMLPE